MPSSAKRERRAARAATALAFDPESYDPELFSDIGMPTHKALGYEPLTEADLDLSAAEGIPASDRDRKHPRSGKPSPVEDEPEEPSEWEVEAENLIKKYKLRVTVSEVRKQLNYQRATAIAREVVREEMAAVSWTPPEDEGSLSDWLDREREHDRYMVDGLMGAGHNVVLAARYKTGKTTLIQNLAADLVAGRTFLGRETFLREGSIAWINGEMDPHDWTDTIRPLVHGMDRETRSRIIPLHRRGGSLPILEDGAAAWFVEWLRARDVRLIILDSWRKLCVWSGVNENENQGAERLTDRIDQIKAEAGVSGFLTLAHMGRGEGEHARGATALDDWVDARWTMSRERDDVRHLAVEGRGVRLDKTPLLFDPECLRISAGEGSGPEWAPTVVKKVDPWDDPAVRAEAVKLVHSQPGITTTRVQALMGFPKGKGHAGRILKAAEEAGEGIRGERRTDGKGGKWFPVDRS